MRILVAEDEQITRASLVRQLEGWGHAVTSAPDGQKAWDDYRAGEFDIVITDWEMPRLSGVELITRIRGVPAGKYVYLMMLTSRGDKADLVRGIEAGADDFLSKPFDRDELRVRLLAGERIVSLERALSAQNVELRAATERMRGDLRAAARVQRAMLPRGSVATNRVRTAWKYVPTDELAGDALGVELIEERYLVAYVVDVSGHGVPAALLAVTAMHAMSGTAEGTSLVRGPSEGDGIGAVRSPARVLAELNRRFCAGDHDGRFLTMILCVLDTHDGRAHISRAGHPLPIVQRGASAVPFGDEGGLPIGLVGSAEYEDVVVPLQPGDRLYLYSDGFVEQLDPTGRLQFGEARLRSLLCASGATPAEQVVAAAVHALAEWAGAESFIDDLSLILVEWTGR